MKKKKIKPAKSAGRFPRRSVMIVTAIAVVVIAAITVVSRQSTNGSETKNSEKATTVVTNPTIKVAGQDVGVDSKGQIRPLTPEEAKKLADGLKGMLNKSSEGLVEEHHADGSVTVDLQDRFQSVTVARVNKDGSISQSCVDNPRAAGAFFGIDPKLIQRNRATTQPNPQ